MDTSALGSVIQFLLEELRFARGRAISVSDEVQMHILTRRAARRTRRLEYLASVMRQLDAETPASSS